MWLIACNEWRHWWHARTPALLLLALMGLWAITALTAHHHWQGHAQNLARVTQQSQQDWDTQPERHPHRVAHYGDFVAKPIHPLSIIEPGILDQSGYLVYLEAHRLNSANFNTATEATSLGRFPVITPAMMVQWWLPLCLIMIGYACITNEKVSGTLAYLQGNGTSALTIASGKWLALMVPAALLIIGQISITAAWIWNSDQALLRLALMCFSQLVYMAAWCWLIILVSWHSQHLHSALLALLLFWVCICVVLPRGLANLAQIHHPTQPRTEAEFHAEQKLKSMGDSHNPNDPYFEEFKTKLLKQYGVNNTLELPMNYNALVMQESERLTTQVYREQQALHDQQLHQQNAFIRIWLWLSPSLALQYLHMASSGNDIAHYQAFIQQAEERRYQLIQYLNQVHAQEVQMHDDKNTRISTDFWKNAPRTPIQLAQLNVSQHAIWAAISVLLLWLILPCVLLARLIKRT